MSMIFFLVPEMHSSFAFWLAKWPELGQKAMSDTQTQAWNYRITEQLPRSCEWLSKGQKYEQHYLWLSEWFDIHSLSSFVRRLVLSKLCQAKDYLKNDLRQAQYTVKKKKKGQFRCIPGDKNPAPDVEVVLLSCCCQICLPLDKEFSFLQISFVTFSQGSSYRMKLAPVACMERVGLLELTAIACYRMCSSYQFIVSQVHPVYLGREKNLLTPLTAPLWGRFLKRNIGILVKFDHSRRRADVSSTIMCCHMELKGPDKASFPPPMSVWTREVFILWCQERADICH